MSQNISQYIQEQMEAAGEKRRNVAEKLYQQVEAEDQEKQRARVIETLRCLALIGIEASSDQLGLGDNIVYFVSNGFRLEFSSLVEADFGGSRFGNPTVSPTNRCTRFSVKLVRTLPQDVKDEYINIIKHGVRGHGYFGDYDAEYGFYNGRFNGSLSIEVISDPLFSLACLPKDDLEKIFDVMAELESNYQSAYESHKVWAEAGMAQIAKEKNEAEIAPSPSVTTPKFTYTGNSRAEILAQLIHDIANHANLDCSFCGRRAVDPVDFYCKRCGVDYGEEFSNIGVEADAIEKGYYRQILTEALRVINELHLSGGTRYNEEWLAKANAFMAGKSPVIAAAEVDTEEIIPATLEEVAQIEAEYQASLAEVTLNQSDIDYLAQCERQGNYFIKINDEAPPISTAKLGRVMISDPNCKYYFLTLYYNTPANHAAIAKRRDELNLGEQS